MKVIQSGYSKVDEWIMHSTAIMTRNGFRALLIKSFNVIDHVAGVTICISNADRTDSAAVGYFQTGKAGEERVCMGLDKVQHMCGGIAGFTMGDRIDVNDLVSLAA